MAKYQKQETRTHGIVKVPKKIVGEYQEFYIQEKLSLKNKGKIKLFLDKDRICW